MERLNEDWEDFTDKGKQKFLTKLLSEYSNENYYVLMGVSQTDINSLKSNYKKLALALHPDKSAGKIYREDAQKLFTLVGSAYETLNDETKERNYKSSLRTSAPLSSPSTPSSDSTSSSSTSLATWSPNSLTTWTHSSLATWSFNWLSAWVSTLPTIFPRIMNNTFLSVSSFRGATLFSTIRQSSTIRGGTHASGGIQNLSQDIIIQGDSHSNLHTVSGDIIVYGSVYGTVSSVSGDITIHGSAYENVSSISGDINIHGSALKSVSTLSGDVNVQNRGSKFRNY